MPTVTDTLSEYAGISIGRRAWAEEYQNTRQRLAATRIQQAWREKKRTEYLRPDVLWSDATVHARMKLGRNAADEGKNDIRERWRRAAFLASRLQDGNVVMSGAKVQDLDAARKHLETQHWLELVDGKHRYGSNLKYYHRQWQGEDTSDNFFKWLDRGGGKSLSLNECPREQLERQRITYLSIKQRLNYLVEVDNEGKLRWSRNGELVDTTPGRWKDAGGGQGVVHIEDPQCSDRTSLHRRHSLEEQGADISAQIPRKENGDLHYTEFDRTRNPIKRVYRNHFTVRGLFDRLFRKTLRRNTWIYVSDKNFNIFIGIKDTGTFQHSSFLAGGLVTSAGLISVHEGCIHTLSPLSGHYRTTIQHFRRFIAALEERGVDMHKVRISKAEAALYGIECLAKFKSKREKLVNKSDNELKAVREGVTTLAHPVEEVQSWRRDILEGRKGKSVPVRDESKERPCDRTMAT